jgi:hypothetical protein
MIGSNPILASFQQTPILFEVGCDAAALSMRLLPPQIRT